jgi:hypothetical protein
MKKLLLAGIVLSSSLFATSLEDRVSALEKRVAQLEAKVDKTEKVQQKIVKKQEKLVVNVAQTRVMSCSKIKIVDFDYKNTTIGLDKGYKFTFNIKNDYNKTISKLDVMIGMIDNEDDTLVQEHLIKDNLHIAPKQTTIVNDKYIINDSLSEYLGKTPKSQIKLDVRPLKIKFSDGTTLKCSRW